jgi:hypothetical protein
MQSEGRFTQYAIYRHPKDYPSGFVVRQWHILADGSTQPGSAFAASTLEDARGLLPEGAQQVSGQDPNDPVIVEVWM